MFANRDASLATRVAYLVNLAAGLVEATRVVEHQRDLADEIVRRSVELQEVDVTMERRALTVILRLPYPHPGAQLLLNAREIERLLDDVIVLWHLLKISSRPKLPYPFEQCSYRTHRFSGQAQEERGETPSRFVLVLPQVEQQIEHVLALLIQLLHPGSWFRCEK